MAHITLIYYYAFNLTCSDVLLNICLNESVMKTDFIKVYITMTNRNRKRIPVLYAS